MEYATVWWVLAGLVVAAELLTGSLYLLMIALGLASGAVSAHAGLGIGWQIAIAGVVMSVATGLWHAHHQRTTHEPKTTANKNINLDVGETVIVEAWSHDGSAQVNYRGAKWQASMATDVSPTQIGAFRIDEVVGSRLMISPINAA